jgi:MoxR-like ATPase
MQERQVTIGDQTFKLDEPFLVLATENPLEQEGTYPCPKHRWTGLCSRSSLISKSKEEEKLIMRQNVTGEFPKDQPCA